MIVEDDPMVASVNETYLCRLPGFCVIAKAADGLQALEKIKALSGSVDLVLLDVFMPKMDGLSFLEHLKNLAPSVSVIMITASQNKESLRTALAHGVADYIIKPFTFERFKAALITFAERWRLLHEAEDFDQSDLDNIFHRGAPPQQFSKGIDADTLEKILASVNAASAPVSTQEVADDVGLSRISVRKYLSYLEENNRIQGGSFIRRERTARKTLPSALAALLSLLN